MHRVKTMHTLFCRTQAQYYTRSQPERSVDLYIACTREQRLFLWIMAYASKVMHLQCHNYTHTHRGDTEGVHNCTCAR